MVKVVISDLVHYPVKSLRAVNSPSLKMSSMGLYDDRRWMVVDHQGDFLSQRQLPKMAILSASVNSDGLLLRSDAQFGSGRQIAVQRPADTDTSCRMAVTVWGNQCQGVLVDDQVNQWLSNELERPCRLVYMPMTTSRLVQGFADNRVGFADGYPLLLTSQASLQALNLRLKNKNQVAVTMDRFRPNLVIEGDSALEPFAEDQWASLTLGNLRLINARACGRCMVVNTDQASGVRHADREPLATLREFRMDSEDEICFGINLVPELINGAAEAIIRPGDRLEVEWK